MPGFLTGLFLLSASTMIYEVMMTRLLSVVSWYYLALVAVGMAMSGMTAGALVVQLRPDFFDPPRFTLRLRQGALAMAAGIPVALIGMLAVPLFLAPSLEVLFSFILFTAFAGLPFFFSGIVVCLALTRTAMPIGRVYLADLLGAAAGCLLSMWMIEALGAPGAILGCAALAFLAAAAFARASDAPRLIRRYALWAAAFGIVAMLNATTRYGIAPIWSKGYADINHNVIAEIWNPISRVKVTGPYDDGTYMFGPSPKMPQLNTPMILLTVDNFADTPMYRRNPGAASQFGFLNYDVTELAYRMRGGGSAAIIGLGGGRDALAAWLNGFSRVAGVEVNPAIVDLDVRRLNWWGGLREVPGLKVFNQEGRSFMTRSSEKFDVIQASMIDTEAATAAGAMTMAENSLYTLEAWRIFYQHLAPGGLLTFSRWAPANSPQIVETLRIFSMAWATLLSEGVSDPAGHLALVRSGQIATLLVSNRAFSSDETARLRKIVEEMQFEILYSPGQPPALVELNGILTAKTVDDLAGLRYLGFLSFAPVFDASPFFFNFVRPSDLPRITRAIVGTGMSGNVQAMVFLLLFTIASLVLLGITVAIPLSRIAGPAMRLDSTLGVATIYFGAIGFGFMLAEAAMMQQLTLLLGSPAYSLVTVLAGLVFFAGLGSLASDRIALTSRIVPALSAALVLLFLSGILLPIAHRFAGEGFAQRIALAIALVILPGLAMGGCFPVGLRWLRAMKRDEILPWMWAVNGAASVAATFAGLLISMQFSIAATVALGGACYLVAACAIVVRGSRRQLQPIRTSAAAGR